MAGSSHLTRCLTLVALALAPVSCGGHADEAPADEAPAAHTPAPTEAAPNEAPAQEPRPAAPVQVRDDTPEAAVETWLAAIAAADLDSALAVLDPESPGAVALRQTRDGLEKAKADPAAATLMGAIGARWAEEIGALTYEMTTLAGDTATFRFSSPDKTDPWEITVKKTPDGWRVIPPPDTGLPQG